MHPKEVEWFKEQLKNPKHIVALAQHVKPVPSKMTGPEFIRLCRYTTLSFDDALVDTFYGLLVDEGLLHLISEAPKTYRFSQKMLDIVAAYQSSHMQEKP